MKGVRTSWVLLGLSTVLYLLLTTPLCLLAAGNLRSAFLFLLLHQAFALGLAIELAELALALVLPPRSHPLLPEVDRSHVRVAVLYLCRDDVDEEALLGLADLHGADVFVLDDSETEHFRNRLDRSGLRVVRRSHRTDFKAGNLNHWLAGCGASYQYFVILDSDSLLSEDALWSLVACAEHPANRDVAIVQAALEARRGNSFQNVISCGHRLRQEVLCRVHDRVGWSLSQGHNNLHRVEALQGIGGFSTAASCEDTATSLALLRQGWRIVQASTPSLEAEPINVFAYRRRLVRWARQTIDLIRRLDGGRSAGQVLLLARHLLSYLLPFVSTALIVLLFWYPSFSAAPRGTHLVLTPDGRRLAALTVASLWSALLALVFLRFLLFRRCGGNFGAFVRSTLLSGAVANFCNGPLEVGLTRSLLGAATVFRATGSFPVQPIGFGRLAAGMTAPLAFFATTLFLGFERGRQGFGLVQSFWLAIGLASPAVLWLFHRDQGRKEQRCAA